MKPPPDLPVNPSTPLSEGGGPPLFFEDGGARNLENFEEPDVMEFIGVRLGVLIVGAPIFAEAFAEIMEGKNF